MDSRYDHGLFEDQIYQLWQDLDAFNPDRVRQLRQEVGIHDSSQTPFSIIMPPPNANDPLHIGHAMGIAVEDALIRFHRMWGDDAVWMPGTDHAGIETQFVFEKKLKKEDKSRFDFNRQELFDKIWAYVQENSDVAVSQMKKLGASADWSRFTFTLDEPAVNEAIKTFKKLFDDRLVYRDKRLVNFCTHCGTSFSELEVARIERTTPLYYVKYPLAENPEQFVAVATTRPEPIFVDTHLAVNPKDKKNNHLIGQKVLNPIHKGLMEIIGDEFVDPEFGTGVVKLTPAHDFNDFEVAKKHGLEIIEAIDTTGKIMDTGGEYAGMKVLAAREKVVSDLIAKGLVDQSKIKNDYTHTVGTCYRCGRVLEPLPLPQWFIKVKDDSNNLTKKALQALEEKQTTIHGAGHDKILKHWLNNLNDWNISRQIVWGIRIPIWYDVSSDPSLASVSFITPDGSFKTGPLNQWLEKFSMDEIENGLQQTRVEISPQLQPVFSQNKPTEPGMWLPETDTFDTWFSSAQWPITVFKANRGATNDTTDDFDRFYPTAVMETAYDILMFWVMRMMLMGIYLTGKSPFKDVYLHGLIRDPKGQKMSKSKGNVINPLEIVKEFGADAVRMALVIRSTAGIDKSVGQPDFKAARNLTNKIWNAARFVIMQEVVHSAENKISTEFDSKLEKIVQQTTKQLEELKIGLAADNVYNEFWHWYCDECIESYKNHQISHHQLLNGLIVFLKLLHPFLPFVTEAVWQELFKAKHVDQPALIISSWPI